MRTIRQGTTSRQCQKFKLDTLFDFHEANPNEEYRLIMQNGFVQTLVGYSEGEGSSRGGEESSGSINIDQAFSVVKKSQGLFANLIKNMKEERANRQTKVVPSQTPPKRPYCFYYGDLEKKATEVSPTRHAASAKKVKERATGIVNMNAFRKIEFEAKQSQKANNMIQQKPLQGALINKSKEEQISKENDGKEVSRKPLTVDFSFQSEEKSKVDLQEQARTQIKIIDKEEKKVEETKDKVSKFFLAKPNINPKLIKQQEVQVPQIIIHEQHRQSEKMQAQSSIPPKQKGDSKDGQQLKQICVQGAKQTQSRIYNNSKNQEPRDVKIDFDLDLNFI